MIGHARMSERHIWVLDPGKTTGFVTYDRELDEYIPYELNFKDTCAKLMTAPAASLEGGLLLAAEGFIITPQTAKNTQAPWSLELIGVTRMVSEVYLQRPLIIQQPSAAKRFSTDTRLKRMGWYRPGKGHANDGGRHLLLLLATRGLLSQDILTEFAELA